MFCVSPKGHKIDNLLDVFCNTRWKKSHSAVVKKNATKRLGCFVFCLFLFVCLFVRFLFVLFVRFYFVLFVDFLYLCQLCFVIDMLTNDLRH